MKTTIRLLLLLLAFLSVLWTPRLDAQTLGEVLQAIQNRYELSQEPNRVKPQLQNQVDAENGWDSDWTIPSIDLIQWDLGSKQTEAPTDADLNGLTPSQQVAVLRQAWAQVEALAGNFLDLRKTGSSVGMIAPLEFERQAQRIGLENYHEMLSVLAQRVRRMSALPWPVRSVWSTTAREDKDASRLPHSPLKYDAESIGQTFYAGKSGTAVRFNTYPVGVYFGATSQAASDGNGNTYDNASTIWSVSDVRSKAPDSFGGTIQVWSDVNYQVNAIDSGLSEIIPGNSLYDPGNQRWDSHAVAKGGDLTIGSPPGGLGSAAAFSFQGDWKNDNTWWYFVPRFKDETTPSAVWADFYRPPAPDFESSASIIAMEGWASSEEITWSVGPWGSALVGAGGDGPMRSQACFVADFGNEFSSTPTAIPETPPSLEIIPDLASGELKVRLANTPANDCELVWKRHLPDLLGSGGAFSARSALDVRGCGDWTAVYSGKPEDREPKLPWNIGRFDKQGRWDDFDSYIEEWWRPVLTQLVTATYALNITRPDSDNRYKYQIEFYRRDQLGAKDNQTGRYSFPAGTALETFIVENPSHDDAQADKVRITTTKAVYDLQQNADSSWSFIVTDKATSAELLSKNILVTGTYSDTLGYVTATVDETSVDSQPLPTVTTTYWDSWPNPLRIDQMVEEAGNPEGTRTTTYSYDWILSDYGFQVIDHLTGVTQTGGVAPYSNSYDANELLTSGSSGPWQTTIAYGGSTATRTESFSGNTVRTLSTNYSSGMATATTTVDGASDALAMTVLYSGTDSINPWSPQRIRGFDGSLTTFDYQWEGANFVITEKNGRGTSDDPNTVAAGTKTVTKINPAGKVFSTEVFDLESNARVDWTVATNYQTGAGYFPITFDCPLHTEGYSYDGQGQVASHTDRLGKTTSYMTRDGLGRLTQAVRDKVTMNIGYNPGHLGSVITLSSTNEANRTQEEQYSPFGGSQITTITGPENITISRVETSGTAGTAGTITTVTANSTTARTVTETVQKDTLATSVTGNATEPWNVTYSVASGGGWKKTAKHGTAAALTASTTCDALGRVMQEEIPSPTASGTAVTTYGYTGGRLHTRTEAAGTPHAVTTTYSYQPDGSLEKAEKAGRFVSVSRVADESDSSQIKWQWKDATGDVLSQRVYYPLTGKTEEIPWGNPARTITLAPAISGDVLTLTGSGTLVTGTTQWKDGAPYQQFLQSAAGRMSGSATANAFGEVTSLTLNPGAITGNAVTTSFSPLGLPTGVTGPSLNASATHSFDAVNGQTSTVTVTSGSATHTTTQSVSPKGDLLADTGYARPDANWSAPAIGASTITKTLTTGAGAAQFTTNLAGQLTERRFPDGTGESFTYNEAGAAKTWVTPRASFDLAPNAFGEPTQLGSMGSLGYDLAGRVNWMSTPADTLTQSYVEGEPDVENHTAGVLKDQSVDRDYDSLGRLQSVKLPGNVTITYGYDPVTKALSTVTTAGGATGTWSDFDPVTGRAKNFSFGVLSTTGSFDGLGRVTSHSSTAAGVSYAYSDYRYDDDGHCYQRTTPNGVWDYAYDGNGYLQSAARTGKLFAYNVDEAGRLLGAIGSDYFPTKRLNDSTIEVFGSVTPNATLTINGAAVAVNGATGAFSQTYTPAANTWQSYTVRGTLAGAGASGTAAVAEETRSVFVPPQSETLSHDPSGNRTGDARLTQSWNGLDQLTRIEETSPLSASTKTQVDFAYDLKGRRVEKKTSVGGTVTRRTTTLWDGWRPVLEIDYNASGTETARRYYTWGPDLSGSLDGAAGIGGLLEILEKKSTGSTTTTTRSLPLYDGIGNVVGLVDGATGAQVATYEYGPFGEVITAYGERASSCPFRFQTKLYDEESGYLYFGKRYYDPKTQTWLSRDPLREDGGVNLYAYCGGDPVGGFDPVGLWDVVGDHPGEFDVRVRPDGSFAVRGERIVRTGPGLLNAYNEVPNRAELAVINYEQTGNPKYLDNAAFLQYAQFGWEWLPILGAHDPRAASEILVSRFGWLMGSGRPPISAIPITASIETRTRINPGTSLQKDVLFPNRFPEDIPSPSRRLTLVQRNGAYKLLTANGELRTPRGEYNFVTIGNEVIVSKQGGHIDISNGNPVSYAGGIQFTNKGELKLWNNNSGHYKPDSAYGAQAGLPMDKFQPIAPEVAQPAASIP